MKENRQRNPERPLHKLFGLLQRLSASPVDLLFTTEIPSPQYSAPSRRAILPLVIIPPQFFSSIFSLLSVPPYQPFYYHHFIDDCYIFHAEWM